MRNPGPSGALTALLLVIAGVFAYRTSPLVANVDDHVRLYFGGYVGGALLGGGARAEALSAEVRRTTAGIAAADEYLASRFVAAQTPYSPLTVASVAGVETARPLFRPSRVLPWVLREQTLLWAAMLVVALAARSVLPACPLAWFLAVGLTLSWIHAHTSPLYPVPRAFACLFTGLALALAATGASFRWAAACAVLAAAAHPYNQAFNLAVVLPAAAIVAGTPAAPALRQRRSLVLAAIAVVALAASAGVLLSANPRGVLGAAAILGEEGTPDLARNWELSRTPMQRLGVGLGLPLCALVLRYAGRWRAALVALLFAATVLAAGLLAPTGHYAGEYLARAGGAWSAVLLALCLRRDLLPDLSSLTTARRVAVIGLTGLVALPAALPEVANVPQSIHRPWGGWPGGIRLSRVELECLRILRASGGWPPRR